SIRAVASPMPELAPVTTARFTMLPVFTCFLYRYDDHRTWAGYGAHRRSGPRHLRGPHPDAPVGQRPVRDHRARRDGPCDPAADLRLAERPVAVSVLLRVPHAGAHVRERLLLTGRAA